MEDGNSNGMTATLERLAAAAEALEKAAERMTEQQIALSAEAQGSVQRIVATVESEREAELARRLEEAEAKIAQLTASAASGRKTLAAGTATMLAKHGVALDSIDAAALDTALHGLSIEQRIAVKAELLRSGLLA